MKKTLAAMITLFLMTAMLLPLSVGAVEIGTKYEPYWSKTWMLPEADGMWRGFYIKKEDNKLKTDLVKKSGGEWAIPGSQFGSIWEGQTNVCAPADGVDVGYVFKSFQDGKVEFSMKGHMDVKGCTEINFGVYKGNFNNCVWPENGKELTINYGAEVDVNMVLDLKKDDQIFFRFHSPVEVANSPNFRFKEFYAIYRADSTQPPASSAAASSTGTPSKESKPDSKPVESKNDTSSTATSETSASSETTSEPSGGGDVIIDIDDSYYLTPKFEDVIVDEENDKITLTRKLTRKDLMESFTIKDGHTIVLKDTETTEEVTDDNAEITDKMILTVFNQGTPVTNISIVTDYPDDGGAAASTGFPVWAIVLIVIGAVVVVAGVVVAVIFVMKKKSA